MKISEKKVVALTYTLTVDGQVADQTTEDRPLDFIFGMGYLLPKFEENIAGKEPGDTFEFTLTPSEGYGEHNPDMIVELPKHIFEVDGKIQEGLLTVGNMIPMMNQQGGVMHGKVHEVKDNSVMMNFNHPMAGKTLNFTGKILTVRDGRPARRVQAELLRRRMLLLRRGLLRRLQLTDTLSSMRKF